MQKHWQIAFYLNYRKALVEIKREFGINRIDFEVLAIMDQKEMMSIYCKPSDVLHLMPTTKRKLVYDSFRRLHATGYLTLVENSNGRKPSRYAINGIGNIILLRFSQFIERNQPKQLHL